MKMHGKEWFALMTAVVLLIGLVSFVSAETEEPPAQEGAAIDLSDYFSKRDLSGMWDTENAVYIHWENGQAQSEGAGAEISGEDVRIVSAGVYVLTGTAANATVTVDVTSDDKVQLVLSGVTIRSTRSAAILVENADKVFITLDAGTDNTLANESGFEESGDVDAVIFSRDDVTLNGSGSLTVVSAGHGIVGKDDLKITGGIYDITAAGRGIDANDSIRIYDGSITVQSEKDALRAKHDDENEGWILIAGGTIRATVGSGAQNGKTHTESWGRQRWSSASDADSGESQKGIKASGNLVILDGDITVNAEDDALHTNNDLWIADGQFTLSSGDDGMHADRSLTISGGDIQILTSYEGIEAQSIAVSGGNVALTASDDGLNAAGGNDSSGFGWNDMFSSDGVSSITISGGTLSVNAAGDGIDSNGDLAVSGGTIVVSGPTNSGNGALDYNGNAVISGGTVVAAGAVGMSQNFGQSSTQPSVLVNITGIAGSELTVTDAQGQEILRVQLEKQFQCAVISSPDMKVGETYTVSTGSASTAVTVSSMITGGGSSMGGWGHGGGRNNMNDGSYGGPAGQDPQQGENTPPDAAPENGMDGRNHGNAPEGQNDGFGPSDGGPGHR